MRPPTHDAHRVGLGLMSPEGGGRSMRGVAVMLTLLMVATVNSGCLASPTPSTVPDQPVLVEHIAAVDVSSLPLILASGTAYHDETGHGLVDLPWPCSRTPEPILRQHPPAISWSDLAPRCSTRRSTPSPDIMQRHGRIRPCSMPTIEPCVRSQP